MERKVGVTERPRLILSLRKCSAFRKQQLYTFIDSFDRLRGKRKKTYMRPLELPIKKVFLSRFLASLALTKNGVRGITWRDKR